MFLSIVWRIVELALGKVSSIKLQWNKEYALGDRWERTDLWVEVENFFLSDWSGSLMHERWGVVKMKQLIAVAIKSLSESKIPDNECAEKEFLIKV